MGKLIVNIRVAIGLIIVFQTGNTILDLSNVIQLEQIAETALDTNKAILFFHQINSRRVFAIQGENKLLNILRGQMMFLRGKVIKFFIIFGIDSRLSFLCLKILIQLCVLTLNYLALEIIGSTFSSSESSKSSFASSRKGFCCTKASIKACRS